MKRMHRKAVGAFAVLLSLVMMMTCVQAAPVSSIDAEEDGTAARESLIDAMLDGRQYVEGEVLVIYNDSVPSGISLFEVGDEQEELGTASVEAVEEVFEEPVAETAEDAVSIKVISSEDKTTRELLEELIGDPAVISAEPNYIFESQDFSEDVTGEVISDILAEDDIPAEDDLLTENEEILEPARDSEEQPSAEENFSPEDILEMEAEPEDPDDQGEVILNEDATIDTVLPQGETKDFIKKQGYDLVSDLSYLQWGYGETDAAGHYSIHSPNWNTKGGTNVAAQKEAVVAVIDSGIDYTHPDLAPVMVDMTQYGMSKGGKYGYNSSGAGDETDPIDHDGHGTHCAGIIAAAWDGQGTSGVASGVKLCAVRTSVNGTFSDSAIAKAYFYLIEACDKGMNLKSVNCSFGGEGFSNAERVLVTELGRKGVVTCYASGNSAMDNDKNPATSGAQIENPYALVINSANPSFKKADYSNFGKDTTAFYTPGDAILAPVCFEAARYLPMLDPQRKAYDTFASEGDAGVKAMYLDTIDVTKKSELTYSKDEFCSLIDGWKEAGNKVTESESFDGDGCSYEIAAPKIRTKNDKAVYLVSVPIDKADAEAVSRFGFSVKSTLSKAIVWVRPVSYDFEGNVQLDFSGTEGWLRPSDVWCSFHTVMDSDTGYPYYNGRMYFFVMLEDFQATSQSSNLYLDCVGAGTDVLRYVFFQGTSMAAPAATGSVPVMFEQLEQDGSLEGLTKAEQAAAVVDAMKGSTKYDPDFDSLCTSNGALDFDVAKEDYTPVIHSVTIGADGLLTIKGRYFGSKEGTLTLDTSSLDPIDPYADGSDQERDIVQKWTDAEITAKLGKIKLNGLHDVEVTASNGKKTERSAMLYGTNGAASFEGRITMPEEIKDCDIESIIGVSGKVYLLPQSLSKENGNPLAPEQLWSYDLASETWKQCKDIPIPEVVRSESRSPVMELNSYGDYVIAHLTYKADGQESGSAGIVPETLEKIYLYNPSKDTWTEADLGNVKIPSKIKVFGTDNGVFFAGGEFRVVDESMTDEDGTVYYNTEYNTTIWKLQMDDAAIKDGKASVTVTELKNSGKSEAFNSYASVQTFGDTTIALAKTSAWLKWSDDTQKFTVEKTFDLDTICEQVGKAGTSVIYLNTITCGANTPFGAVFVGVPGNRYTDRGFDSFYLSENGEITAFEKLASYADIYNSKACYTNGYLVVWGDSYYAETDTSGYMAYTKLVKEATPEVTLSKTSVTYNGKVKTPSVTVKVDGLTLKKNVDYTVKYPSGRKNAGSYSVKVTLKGCYSGSASKTFKINKAANPLKVKAKTATVKYTSLKKKAQTLALSKILSFSKKGQGTVTYTLSAAKRGTKSYKNYFAVNKKTGKVTVKKGLSKGTYKLTVKVKASGNANYKAATKTIKVVVKVK